MKSGCQTLAVFALSVLFFCGCEERTVAAQEASERTDTLFRKAIDAETIADFDTALRLYQELVQDKPRIASAHLQLAILLHDKKEDYMGAVYHYNRYLALQPESEKRAMVQDRIQKAEQLLTSQLFRRVGNQIQGFTEAELLKAKENLERELTHAQAELSRANEQILEGQKKSRELETQVEQLRKLVAQLRTAAATPSKGTDAAEIADIRAQAEKAGAGDSNDLSIEDVRGQISKMLAPPEPKAEPPAASVRTPEKPAAASGAATAAESRKPAPKLREYTVQSGDTLYRISEKFYGNPSRWKEIRDANRTRIDPDGRLRIGQVILIP